MMQLRLANYHVLVFFWTCAMTLAGLIIYKFVLYPILITWHYMEWNALDWTCYAIGVAAYASFWLVLSIQLTIWIAKKANIQHPVKP